MNCPKCDSPVADSAAFCTVCGAQVPPPGSPQSVGNPGTGVPQARKARPNALKWLLFAGVVIVLYAAVRGFLPRTVGSTSEADALAHNYWNERMTKCEGNYLLHNANQGSVVRGFAVMEYKGMVVWVKMDELSEVEKLNGFEWRGQSGVVASAWRSKPLGGRRMSDWMGDTQAGPIHFWKRNGKVEVRRGPYDDFEVHPDCSLLK